MNTMEQSCVVLPLKSPDFNTRHENMPPRSRLYRIVPCGLGALYQECLTSYLNRLGRSHHVSPRDLAAQEVIPFIDREYPKRHLATFSREGSIQVNGNG